MSPLPADRVVVVDRLRELDLVVSRPVVYDAPIGLRLLHQEPGGAEHYLVRYPAGLTARWHRHTAAQSIVVLEGMLEANGEVVGPGSFCHFAAGEPMHHVPAGDAPCLFVTTFHGPFDVEPVGRPDGPGES